MSRNRLLILSPLVLLLLAFCGGMLLSIRPDLGAAAAKPVRNVIGNQNVAKAETLLFSIQDRVRSLQFELGLAEAAQPWTVSTSLPTPTVPPAPAATIPPPKSEISGSDFVAGNTPTASVDQKLPDAGETVEEAQPTATNTPAPTATPMPRWRLPDLTALADAQDEGIWQPYLFDQSGQAVAMRTFLLPDAERPYAVTGIVAFDLNHTNLHYVLGLDEPRLPAGPRGGGQIPSADKESARLIAAFNGGFMAAHGGYGAMAQGTYAVPPVGGAATLTIGPDSAIQIGTWGGSIDPSGEYVAYRQNARMVIEDGLVTDRVHTGTILTWGGNIDGYIVTWRSGIGLNAAGDVLYYFAGPSLSMLSLARAMQTAGVHDGFLLDINPTWVHFTAIEAKADGLHVQPLFDEGMQSSSDRYIGTSLRDFFYVTLK